MLNNRFTPEANLQYISNGITVGNNDTLVPVLLTSLGVFDAHKDDYLTKFCIET